TVNGILQKTIFSNVPELLGQSLQTSARTILGQAGASEFNHLIASAVADSFGGNPERILKDIEAGDFGLRRLDAEDTTEDANQTTDFFSHIVKIETEQVVGANVKSPGATRIVGGWAMHFLLFALSASATGLFR